MKKLLSGNEALALGAYQAGVTFASAYPGTPSTEIMESIARFKDIYAEWSTNEKVAMEVAMGACYAGARALVSMKQVGLNVAADPFLAVATTGVNGGLVLISADDPGIHSSQGEQDNRHYAELAKVPILEPTDSQTAYELMPTHLKSASNSIHRSSCAVQPGYPIQNRLSILRKLELYRQENWASRAIWENT